MVRATVNTEETIRHDLKTLPEGFVVIKRLSYGAKLHRRAMVSKMTIQGNSKGKDFAGEMQLINEAATQYDFAHCIVDHNLDDEQGRHLNFSNVQDITSLDPRVGEEIDKYINELNNFEDDEEDDAAGN
jgi:predicted TIM-barrel fold metal-dependent hydrolase